MKLQVAGKSHKGMKRKLNEDSYLIRPELGMNSISLANIVVHEAQKKPEYYRMGSTVSALLVEKEILWSANVGERIC